MRLPIVIVEMLQRKSGNDLCLPSDCEFLSLDIESKIGVHLGATTLKRLLGFAKDERAPHASTLEVIAQYLGFPHWGRSSMRRITGILVLTDRNIYCALQIWMLVMK